MFERKTIAEAKVLVMTSPGRATTTQCGYMLIPIYPFGKLSMGRADAPRILRTSLTPSLARVLVFPEGNSRSGGPPVMRRTVVRPTFEARRRCTKNQKASRCAEYSTYSYKSCHTPAKRQSNTLRHCPRLSISRSDPYTDRKLQPARHAITP